jgi:hypothetical protein
MLKLFILFTDIFLHIYALHVFDTLEPTAGRISRQKLHKNPEQKWDNKEKS